MYKPTAISFFHKNLYYDDIKFCKNEPPNLKFHINKKASMIISCWHIHNSSCSSSLMIFAFCSVLKPHSQHCLHKNFNLKFNNTSLSYQWSKLGILCGKWVICSYNSIQPTCKKKIHVSTLYESRHEDHTIICYIVWHL